MQTAEYLGILAIGLPGAILVWVCLYPLLEGARHGAAVAYVIGYAVQILCISILFRSYSGAAIAWSYCACFWAQAGAAWVILFLRTRHVG
jgi:hypothetical protein